METTMPKPKKKPTKIEELTKEQIRQAILKKRECNTKAQKIVECLIEKGITDEFLLQSLPDINQSHFEDIIEERSIIHLCGYPVCSKTLSLKDIPKQKYRISIKTNKVYDITARKSFCSNNCYNAAMYIKKQMLTSPLWFRNYEDTPKFHLLKVNTIGSMGEEIDVALVQPVKILEKKLFTSINDFANASLHEISPDGKEDDNTKIQNENTDTLNSVSVDSITNDMKVKASLNEDTTDITNVDNEQTVCETQITKTSSNEEITATNKDHTQNTPQTSNKDHDTQKTPQKVPPNPLNIVGEIIEKPERKIDPILTSQTSKNTENESNLAKKLPQKKQPLVTALTIEVEKCLAEWFTLDTVLLLFGEEKVREMVADKGECIKKYLNNYTKGLFYSSNAYDQYQALCKKLNMLEIEDRKFDSQTLKKETKPLPDYRMIQEESKRMELKVKAFFAAETNVPEPLIEEPITGPREDDNVTNLPLVDKNSQNALRRRIVWQHLNKVLPDLLRSLGLLSLTISSDVRLLVNTLKLNANNIMFKPIQWTLIAIVVIKLLSLRDKRLEYLLGQPMAFKHMQLLLLSFKQDGGYLERLISWLTDIDRLLDTSDKQFTLE